MSLDMTAMDTILGWQLIVLPVLQIMFQASWLEKQYGEGYATCLVSLISKFESQAYCKWQDKKMKHSIG